MWGRTTVWCAVLGIPTIFPVQIKLSATVFELQEAIAAYPRLRGTCDAADVYLYLAKAERDIWLKSSALEDEQITSAGRVRMAPSCSLDVQEYFGAKFKADDGDIHILVQLPQIAVVPPSRCTDVGDGTSADSGSPRERSPLLPRDPPPGAAPEREAPLSDQAFHLILGIGSLVLSGILAFALAEDHGVEEKCKKIVAPLFWWAVILGVLYCCSAVGVFIGTNGAFKPQIIESLKAAIAMFAAGLIFCGTVNGLLCSKK